MAARKPMSRYLSLEAAALKLDISEKEVLYLLGSGQLTGFCIKRAGKKTLGKYAIVDPDDAVIKLTRQYADPVRFAPLFSRHEAAEVLGITPHAVTVASLAKNSLLKGTMVGNIRYYSATEIRDYLFKKEKRKRKGRGKYSFRLITFLKNYMEKEKTNLDRGYSEELDTLLDEILGLPEPERTTRFNQLWAQLDTLSLLLPTVTARDAAAPSSHPTSD